MGRSLATSVSLAAAIGAALCVPLWPGAGAGAQSSKGKMVADSGFRPDSNGFSFENYGNEGGITNLTPATMQAIYGSAVCANTRDGQCTLVPPAKAQMDSWNAGMNNGHCYGMSIVALAFANGDLQSSSYGSADVPVLKLPDNTTLQSRIAQSFVAQDFPSVKGKVVRGTPNHVLDVLMKKLNAIKDGATESWSLGFYKTNPATGAVSGGHEVTPYAVDDQGDGQFGVLVYDNNYPGKVRTIQFNRNDDTWSYDASTNPNEASSRYEGNAQTKTIELSPVTPGLAEQPWTDGQALDGGKSSLGPEASQTISLDSPNGADHPHLLVTYGNGQRLGFLRVGTGYQFEHPNSPNVQWPKEGKDWSEAVEPDYTVPTNTPVTVQIQGFGLSKTEPAEVSVIGPGYAFTVEVSITPGQVDRLSLTPPNSGTTPTATYRPGRDETVTLSADGNFSQLDWETSLKGTLSQATSPGFQLGPTQLVVDNQGGSATVLQVTSTAIGEEADYSPTSTQVDIPVGLTSIPLSPGPEIFA